MQATQAVFARGVRGGAGVRDVIGDGADGDDVAAAPADHMRDQGPRQEERPREIDAEGALELVGLDLRGRLDEEQTGVVDEDMRDAGVGQNARHRPGDGCRVGDIAAQIRTPVGGGVGQRAREPHDVGARAVQGLGHGEADAPRGSTDDGDLPGKRGVAHSEPRPLYTRRRNSSRVLASWRRAPRSALVTVLEFCFSTPRIIMQRW